MIKVWRTKDGRRIPISQMTDNHLANVMNYLRAIYDQKVEESEFVTNYSGEVADTMDFISDPVGDIETVFPIYKELKKELKSRNRY